MFSADNRPATVAFVHRQPRTDNIRNKTKLISAVALRQMMKNMKNVSTRDTNICSFGLHFCVLSLSPLCSSPRLAHSRSKLLELCKHMQITYYIFCIFVCAKYWRCRPMKVVLSRRVGDREREKSSSP